MEMKTGDLTRPIWERLSGPKVRVVLVAPQNEGNIGAAARALRVSGFNELAIVDLQHPLDRGAAYAMAWGSVDILQNALLTDDFETAISDSVITVATTARPRHSNRTSLDPRELALKLSEYPSTSRVSVVFGREDTGLTNDEMERCELWTTIPAAVPYPSYNLAQSVQVVLYELFRAFHAAPPAENRGKSSPEEVEWFYKRVRERLDQNGFVPRDGMDNFINHARGILGEVMTDEHAAGYLHKFLDGLLGIRKK